MKDQNGRDTYYRKNGIQYDEYGGYYDENGYYHDSEGGYYDDKGYYYPKEGGYFDDKGNYYDENGGYYDEEGYYYPPEGGYYDPDGNYYPPEKTAGSTRSYGGLEIEDLDAAYSTGRSIKRERTYEQERHYEKGRQGTGKRKKKRAGIGSIIAMVLLVFFTIIIVNVGGLYFTLSAIYKGPESARNLMVSTIQETGQLKFVNTMFLSKEEIEEVTGHNSMGKLDAEVDAGLISVGGASSDEQTEDGTEVPAFDIDGFEIVEISGRTYFAKMMVINDPSRVKLTTIYDGSWKEYGKTLDQLVTEGGFLAGVNGGEYQSDSNKGGSPKGIVVCDGQIQYNNPYAGDVMVGFNTDNILIIKEIGGMSKDAVKSLVEELKIRDAVSFKDIADGDDNHFTKLIINGESVSLNGSGSGANPRTVIGQKADGTVLLLVTDGRGAGGHLGATAADVISIMQEYGAVNAANLDGGSSSCMYYEDGYEMTSVTLYYSNASWRLPLAFVVERR